MVFSDTKYNLRIELDTKNCELSPAQLEQLTERLNPLRKPVQKFPVSDLYVTITYQQPSQQYRLKVSLVLPGRTLVTGDVDANFLPAFDRCIRKMLQRVIAYEESMEGTPEQSKHQKGTHQEVLPDHEPDAAVLEEAVRNSDYSAFRTETYVYEESVRKRVGRWIERYPAIAEHIGEDLSIADFVEEVFLTAFERYDHRPDELRMGEWLEKLIDPSIKQLFNHADEELENIEFIRSYRGET